MSDVSDDLLSCARNGNLSLLIVSKNNYYNLLVLHVQ